MKKYVLQFRYPSDGEVWTDLRFSGDQTCESFRMEKRRREQIHGCQYRIILREETVIE